MSWLSQLWARTTVARISIAMGIAGLICVAAGFLTHAQPYAGPLGYHSAMTVGVLAFALALVEGVSYRRTLEILAPLLAVQILGAVRHHVSSAPVGTELVIFAMVGLGLVALQHRFAPQHPTHS